MKTEIKQNERLLLRWILRMDAIKTEIIQHTLEMRIMANFKKTEWRSKCWQRFHHSNYVFLPKQNNENKVIMKTMKKKTNYTHKNWFFCVHTLTSWFVVLPPFKPLAWLFSLRMVSGEWSCQCVNLRTAKTVYVCGRGNYQNDTDRRRLGRHTTEREHANGKWGEMMKCI